MKDSSAPGATSVRPGAVVARRYHIHGVIAAGSTSVVFSGVDRRSRDQQRVAVKILRGWATREPDIVARFLREARTLVQLSSRHTTRIFDVGEHDGAPYIVMERLVGMSGARHLAEQGPLAEPHAVELVQRLCGALAPAHEQGVVHRDIKLSNLFVTKDRRGNVDVKLLDFGICRPDSADLLGVTAQDDLLGTPKYMPPEQLRDPRSVDRRSDIWAVGVVLYRLLSGRMPFAGDTAAQHRNAILRGEVVPLRHHCPTASPGVERVILRCLNPEPCLRFPSAAALMRALADPDDDITRVYERGRALPAVAHLPPPRRPPWARFSAWLRMSFAA